MIAYSLTHRLLSGPVVIPKAGFVSAKSLNTPAVVTRQMYGLDGSVNHIAPSGPAMIAPGSLPKTAKPLGLAGI